MTAMISQAIKSAASYIVGARVSLDGDERILLDEAARRYVGERWSRVGRLVVTTERLVYRPILIGVLERLRGKSPWAKEWPLQNIRSVSLVEKTDEPYLRGGAVVEFHLSDGTVSRLKVTNAAAVRENIESRLG
jgi:hypothetical protein